MDVLKNDRATMLDGAAAIDYTTPRPRNVASLRRLLEIMRCPETHAPLRLDEDGQTVVADPSGYRWPCVDFVPQMFAGLDAHAYPVEHRSNALAPRAQEIIKGTDGLVLNLSAGGSEAWYPHVVEAEAGIFRNTDIVADAHNLPFRDEVFSACVAMNAFEHYHTPPAAADEIYRVLKPGALLLIHTAFLQPVHEPPYHFYNATPFGVQKWFERFRDGRIATSANFNPGYALSWILSDLDDGLRAEGKSAEADLLAGCTLADIARFWREPTTRQGDVWQAFFAASPDLQSRLAAGVEFIGTKPEH